MKYRAEYPRPQLVREKWQNLNGSWEFAFDDENLGLAAGWNMTKDFSEKIEVPFVYQSKLSGIESKENHEIIWYKKNLELTPKANRRYLLHFGAVDYLADVFINGQHALTHEGGHTSFSIDITDHLATKEQKIVVRVFDPREDETIPRGKQTWEGESRGIWYTNTTGIWQTVWLEEVSECYLKKVKLTPLFDDGKLNVQLTTNQPARNGVVKYQITFKGQRIAQGSLDFLAKKIDFSIDLINEKIFRHNFHDNGYAWTPEEPNLFDIDFILSEQDQVVDKVSSYFGMRKIHTEKGMVYLNNKPYYQKLVLDQGYWPESLMTAPNDEAFVKDIQLAKQMGFNGCRKHQKVEDPRFLYWADQLGYLVWGECAAAVFYNEDSANRLLREWMEIIERDYNHPCIVTWVPLNESWGIQDVYHDRQQQHFSQTMYHYIHSIDPTRLVISNDGWALTETDICAIHNYAHGNSTETQKYTYFTETLATKENIIARQSSAWGVYAKGFSNQGEPVLLTEFGGIGFDVSGEPGWGYTSARSEKEFVSEYARIMKALYASKILYGYCYTQLTDVEQEINGILTYDRKPKCDLAEIRAINEGFHVPIIQAD